MEGRDASWVVCEAAIRSTECSHACHDRASSAGCVDGRDVEVVAVLIEVGLITGTQRAVSDVAHEGRVFGDRKSIGYRCRWVGDGNREVACSHASVLVRNRVLQHFGVIRTAGNVCVAERAVRVDRQHVARVQGDRLLSSTKIRDRASIVDRDNRERVIVDVNVRVVIQQTVIAVGQGCDRISVKHGGHIVVGDRVVVNRRRRDVRSVVLDGHITVVDADVGIGHDGVAWSDLVFRWREHQSLDLCRCVGRSCCG